MFNSQKVLKKEKFVKENKFLIFGLLWKILGKLNIIKINYILKLYNLYIEEEK